MMKTELLYNEDGLSWYVMGRDPDKPENVIDTNEYVIKSGEEVMLLDPGGIEIFPPVVTELSKIVDLTQIKHYLCSHQDPDIMSSLGLWLELTPEANVYLSWLWSGFVSHFGHEYANNFVTLQDEGMTITLGKHEVVLVPAHHLHSAGNFHLYCKTSGILFTGDVGAALLPHGTSMFVENFSEHIQYMEKFHKRWMPSEDAKNVWVSRVRKLSPKMICPQHGAIFQGKDVESFLDWFEDLELQRLKRA